MITGIHTLQNRSITTIKPKSCEHFSFSKGVACVLNTRNAFQLRYFGGYSISNSINHYIYRWKMRVWKSNPAFFFSTFAVSFLRRTDFFSSIHWHCIRNFTERSHMTTSTTTKKYKYSMANMVNGRETEIEMT